MVLFVPWAKVSPRKHVQEKVFVWPYLFIFWIIVGGSDTIRFPKFGIHFQAVEVNGYVTWVMEALIIRSFHHIHSPYEIILKLQSSFVMGIVKSLKIAPNNHVSIS